MFMGFCVEPADGMETDGTDHREERILRHAVIPSGQAGRRLDRAATELLAEFSRSRLKIWIESGALTLEGRRAEPKTRVREGEESRWTSRRSLPLPCNPSPFRCN